MLRKYRIEKVLSLIILLTIFSATFVYAEEIQEDRNYNIIRKSYVTGEVTTETFYPKSAKSSRPIMPAYNPSGIDTTVSNENGINALRASGRYYIKPNKFPYTAIGQLEGDYTGPNVSVVSEYTCTASIKGPDILFSAAHCAYDSSLGGWADTIEFYPARDGYNSSTYHATVGEISIAQSYADEHKDDWSIMFIDKDIGDFWWFGLGVASSDLINKSLKTSGYDGDKNGQQWEAVGTVKRIGDNYDENNVIMDLSGLDDVQGGHSGGPIFDNDCIIWSNYTFGGGAFSGGGRAVDSWLYDILQDEYYKSIRRYSRYDHLYS